MTGPIIKTAKTSDEAHVIDALTLAFVADPAVRWVWPDPQRYLSHFPSFAKAFGGNAFSHRSAYYVDGYAGAALWLPPNVHPDVEALAPYCRALALIRPKKTPLEYLSRWAAIIQASLTGICHFLELIPSSMAKGSARP